MNTRIDVCVGRRGKDEMSGSMKKTDEKEVCLYKPYFTIGRLDDCTLIRRILCENTVLKDGRGNH